MKDFKINDFLEEFEVNDEELSLLEHLGTLHQELDQEQEINLDLEFEL